MLKDLGWEKHKKEERAEIFERISQIYEDSLKEEDKLEEKQKAYDEAKATEQSDANKILTAATTAATGLGGMQLMRGLAEQSSDKDAAADMAAYIETMRCTYGDGKQVKAGPDEIELPGANDAELMKLRSEYLALAADLKERKEALGMKPGIESEVILDRATTGLYDDENIGITGGNYGSLYRAQMQNNETDQAKLVEEQNTSAKLVKGGAIGVGAGIAIGIVGNLLINKKKSTDYSERERAVTDLNDIMQEIIDECNKNISELQNNIPNEDEYAPASLDDDAGETYEEYVQAIKGLQPIKDISEIEKIKDHPACR